MSNPVLNDNFAARERVLDAEPMRISGAINKILILLACVFGGAAYTWYLLLTGFGDKAMMLGVGGAIVAFIVSLIIIFSRGNTAKYLSPVYSVAEGLFLGSISYYFNASWKGIVMEAIAGTFIVTFVMLMLYKARVIRYTEKFQAVLLTAMLSVAAIYLIQFIASFFGRGIPGIFEAGIVGIVFSIIVVGIAAMALIQDFWFIEEGANNMLPKNMEWYAAFGLMLTLVWLYLEVIRLLAKVQSRN